MPRYIVNITRDYTVSEGFSRIIEADSQEDAEAAADSLARDSDDNCPDDCSEENGGPDEGAGSFSPGLVQLYRGAEPADYVAGEPLQ
jgi:hypothetical protein